MDIELQLRENLVLEDPGTPFTDAVMARVGDALRGSVGIVWLADERARRRGRRILLGVLVAGAAAAMLALVLRKGGEEVAVQLAAPQPAVESVADAAEPLVIGPPPPAELPPAAEAALPANTFKVQVRPLRNPDNLAGVELAQHFRDRLIARLQAIPNLVLVDPADGGTADYEVRLRLESQPGIVQEVLGDLTSGMHMVLVDAGLPSKFAAIDARIAAEAQMSPAELQRSQRGRQMMSFRGRTTALLNTGLPMSVGLLDQSVSSPSGGDPVDRRAEEVVRTLRNEIFPVDAAFKQSTMATLRDPGVPFNQRLTAQSDLLRIERRDQYSKMDAELIRAGADLALAMPETLLRTVAWENMLETKHPELVPQIARALEIEPDTDIRLRLVKALASDFAGDPAARAVLEVAARANGQQIVRMAALREGQGEAQWQAFVAASLLDTRLPDLQRLQPIADMADMADLTATESMIKLALDDKTLRELMAIVNRLVDSGKSTQTLEAIMALRFVDSPSLADRLMDIVRAPVTGSELTRAFATMPKSAAIGVAATRFPDDPRFRAALVEFSESSDPQLSDWAKEGLEALEARTNPAARKAYFEKLMQQIMPQ
jgi:hypothetical protein